MLLCQDEKGQDKKIGPKIKNKRQDNKHTTLQNEIKIKLSHLRLVYVIHRNENTELSKVPVSCSFQYLSLCADYTQYCSVSLKLVRTCQLIRCLNTC